MGIFGKNDKTQAAVPQSGVPLDPTGGVTGSTQTQTGVASAPPPIQEPSPQPVAGSASVAPLTPVSEEAVTAASPVGGLGMDPSAPPAPPDATVGTEMPLTQQSTPGSSEAGIDVNQQAKDVGTPQESPLSPAPPLASSTEEPAEESGSGSGTTGLGGL